ncbi:MAG: carbamoyltransferase HypF [Nitrospinae bacterium]|nr:carbamoyltransferase HypF [Nitrospinota bacterium]
MERRRIEVGGVVQGVGFRPFIYNLAKRHGLSGFVLNDGKGALMEAQGAGAVLDLFVKAVRGEAPQLAKISFLHFSKIAPVENENIFRIAESLPSVAETTMVSPDTDVCDDCLAEMLNPADRRFLYPFINCTNCGPRYTIVRQTPYDRPYTSMSGFDMCPECRAEYEDPSNRRFHAQPNACQKCGPSLELLDARWTTVRGDPINKTVEFLNGGAIVAIKGVGGYHLACDALNVNAVRLLRERKVRKEKPFALMVRDLEAARGYFEISRAEEELLLSREKPIVLLKGKIELRGIAPGLVEHGLFLPNTPLQHLLFACGAPRVLVMTSGNISDEPIVFEDEGLKERLSDVADYFLTNNRPIVWRCDDSVVRVANGATAVVRRSRGFVPSAIQSGFSFPEILACGGDLKNVFCLAKGSLAIPGPHIGDLWNAEAFRSFKASIEHFKNVFRIEPKNVAVDMHPGYFSSNHGRSLGLPVTEVQHHHAHVASVMAENGLVGSVIGVALDGTGYGPDGTIWGGEVLICSYDSFKRAGHLPKIRIAGGDKSAKEPWRIGAAVLRHVFGDSALDLNYAGNIGVKKMEAVFSAISANVNCHDSTSAGRWFDAVSSILYVCQHNGFEGQAPMMLEAMADKVETGEFDFEIGSDGAVSFDETVRSLVVMAENGGDFGKISAMFHNTVARVVLRLCEKARAETGLKEVCLGGGVFQNQLLLSRTLRNLNDAGFKAFLPQNLPINDGCLSFGQAVIAAKTRRP